MGTYKKKYMTEREKYFCYHYINTGNTKQAAVLAGYRIEPEKKGIQLLSSEKIQKEIERLYNDKKRNLIYKACVGYERLAFGNISDAIRLIYSDNFDSKDLEGMDLFNVSEIKRPKDGAMEIKFFDRLRALEKLEQSNANYQGDINPFYYALEQGMKSLKQGERQDI